MRPLDWRTRPALVQLVMSLGFVYGVFHYGGWPATLCCVVHAVLSFAIAVWNDNPRREKPK